MANNSKILLFLFTLLLYPIYYLHADPLPHGCEIKDFNYYNQNIVLNDTGQQAFYLIQNHSNRSIRMQRIETRNVFMSPPLTAKIDPMSWGAFASNISNFHFQCFILENENLFPAACSTVIEICKYPRARFAQSNQGNYWVSINKSQQQVLNDAVSKGIYLKW